jgi:hypothetical protein
MEKTNYQFELLGGPLAGGTARVRDTEVRLHVVRECGQLRVQPEDAGIPDGGARVIGTYGFSHREESLVWFPAVE